MSIATRVRLSNDVGVYDEAIIIYDSELRVPPFHPRNLMIIFPLQVSMSISWTIVLALAFHYD